MALISDGMIVESWDEVLDSIVFMPVSRYCVVEGRPVGFSLHLPVFYPILLSFHNAYTSPDVLLHLNFANNRMLTRIGRPVTIEVFWASDLYNKRPVRTSRFHCFLPSSHTRG
jgi:hypothetical protein